MGETITEKLARLRRAREAERSAVATLDTPGLTDREREIVADQTAVGEVPMPADWGMDPSRIHVGVDLGRAESTNLVVIERHEDGTHTVREVLEVPPADEPAPEPELLFGDRATCSGCGAPVQWVILPSGKRCPLDLRAVTVVPFAALAESAAPREVLLYRPKVGAAGVEAVGGWVAPIDGPAGVTLPTVTGVRSHFATCPHRDKFRRSR